MIEFDENGNRIKRYFARLSPVREDPHEEEERHANDQSWQYDLAEYDVIELTEGIEFIHPNLMLLIE